MNSNASDRTQLRKQLYEKLDEILALLFEGRSTKRSPMNMKEAAEYTKCSLSTFQKEFREGIWTAIRIKGRGHPKFLPEDLDKDMAAWKELSRYRRK